MSARKWWPERGIEAPIRIWGLVASVIAALYRSRDQAWEARSDVGRHVAISRTELVAADEHEPELLARMRRQQRVRLFARAQRTAEQPVERGQHVLARRRRGRLHRHAFLARL